MWAYFYVTYSDWHFKCLVDNFKYSVIICYFKGMIYKGDVCG